MFEIPRRKFTTAMNRYHIVYPDRSFHDWLGTNQYDYMITLGIYVVNEKQARMVELLLSPHWYTLLKAMEARRQNAADIRA